MERKEAIEVIKKNWPNSSFMMLREALETLIPELKESEDERIKTFIRGLILPHIADAHIVGDRIVHNKDIDNYHKALAWLEKQGEQKSTIEMKTPEESLGIDSDTYNKIVDECIYGEQKPDDKKGMNLVEEKMTPFQKKVFCIIDTTIEEEQGLKQVCDELLRLAHDEIIQKPAWSEEDEEELKIALDTLEKAGQHSSATWLKNVCLVPQSHWKPSDEQMKCLKEACDEHWEPDGLDPLYTLYEQLKAL